MTSLFDSSSGHEAMRKLPEGFRYRPELISPEDEAALLDRV
jgi:hypothetical protein